VSLAVEFERVVAAAQGVGGVSRGGVAELLRELSSAGGGECVKDVDCDAQTGGWRDRCSEDRDRPSSAFVDQLRSCSVGRVVVRGELFMGPGAGELLVGGAEVDHGCGA
jgi:hypothetical protein